MTKFESRELRKIASFNPPEKIEEDQFAKKIPMGFLREYQRKIDGYEFAKYSSGPKFRNGDVLVAKITPCLENGKTAYVDILDKNEVAFGSSEFIVLRAKEDTNSLFLYYLTKSPAFRRKAIGCMEGTSGRKRVNEGVLKLYELPIPDRVTQTNIANVLSALDTKIELNNRINAQLEALAKTLYDYWFVQFDFPDVNGKPYKTSGGKMVYNPTLKREIPEGWCDCELADIIERSGTGLNPRDNFKLGNGENYYVTIKNVSNGKIILDDKCDKVDDEALKIIDRRSQLKVGDVLFTSIEPVGVTYLIHEKPTNWNINESVFTLRPNYLKASSEYLYFLLSSSEMKVFTKNSSTGSIHKGIRHGVLKSFRLAYKNKEIIENYTLLVRPMLARVSALDKENQTLHSLRDWLLPMLMNGQVTVKEKS
jgi:type I restriction enzyme, S subunit